MLTLDEKALGKTAAAVMEELKGGDPSIWTKGQQNQIRIAVAHLVDDEVEIVGARLRELLS